jgi:hypothetical protein
VTSLACLVSPNQDQITSTSLPSSQGFSELPRTDLVCSWGAHVDGDGVEAMYPLLADIEPDDWEDISLYERKP